MSTLCVVKLELGGDPLGTFGRESRLFDHITHVGTIWGPVYDSTQHLNYTFFQTDINRFLFTGTRRKLKLLRTRFMLELHDCEGLVSRMHS